MHIIVLQVSDDHYIGLNLKFLLSVGPQARHTSTKYFNAFMKKENKKTSVIIYLVISILSLYKNNIIYIYFQIYFCFNLNKIVDIVGKTIFQILLARDKTLLETIPNSKHLQSTRAVTIRIIENMT